MDVHASKGKKADDSSTEVHETLTQDLPFSQYSERQILLKTWDLGIVLQTVMPAFKKLRQEDHQLQAHLYYTGS